MPEDDPPIACPVGIGGGDELSLAQSQELSPREPANPDPTGDTEGGN